MGNTQGNPALAYGSALGQLHNGYLAIAPPPGTPVAANSTAPKKKGGQRQPKGKIAVRSVTEVTTEAVTTVALWNRVRDAEERAVTAESGKMAARMGGDKWQAKYEEALEEVKRLQSRSRADEKRMGVLTQCVATLKKRLARVEKEKKKGGGEGVEESSSRSSHSDPPRKRKREGDSSNNQARSTASTGIVPGTTPEKDQGAVLLSQNKELTIRQERDKLADENERLRALLARCGVQDEADFEDVKPEIPPVPPLQAKLQEGLKAAEECNRELMQMLEWYKGKLAEKTADYERLASVQLAVALPFSSTQQPPTTPPSITRLNSFSFTTPSDVGAPLLSPNPPPKDRTLNSKK